MDKKEQNEGTETVAQEVAFTGTIGYTPEQQIIIDKINQMDHYSMCSLWRFAPSGHIYFDKTLPYFVVFKKRLFGHFGGFTPKISKVLS